MLAHLFQECSCFLSKHTGTSSLDRKCSCWLSRISHWVASRKKIWSLRDWSSTFCRFSHICCRSFHPSSRAARRWARNMCWSSVWLAVTCQRIKSWTSEKRKKTTNCWCHIIMLCSICVHGFIISSIEVIVLLAEDVLSKASTITWLYLYLSQNNSRSLVKDIHICILFQCTVLHTLPIFCILFQGTVLHTLAPNSWSCVYSGCIWSMSSLICACWASSFSASDRLVGVSSLATAVCVSDSHFWKWSRFCKKRCSSEASPNLSSRDFNCKNNDIVFCSVGSYYLCCELSVWTCHTF